MSDAIHSTDLRTRNMLEASAGTGKTFALAALFVRAVIVQGIDVRQILAVTFTEAATQELRARVRARLTDALALAQQWDSSTAHSHPDDPPETALARGFIVAALGGDTDLDGSKQRQPQTIASIRARLHRAVADIDQAAIHTIHGFCQRILTEHALDTRQPLAGASLQTQQRDAHRQLAVELWRSRNDDAQAAAFLREQFGDVDSLQAQMKSLLAQEIMWPLPDTELDDSADAAYRQAWQRVCHSMQAEGETAYQELLAAIENNWLKGGEYTTGHLNSFWHWLGMHDACTPPSSAHEKLKKYTTAGLTAGVRNNHAGKQPQGELFDALQAFEQALADWKRWQERLWYQHLHQLRQDAEQRDVRRKHRQHVRSFDDLINAVYAALQNTASRQALCTAIAKQFQLALIDEFQDTDARQWAIFDALFAASGLVLVGDPKQAIYAFRGGDVRTYVKARDSVPASHQHALEHNFRSRPCVLQAVEALFADVKAPGMGAGIDFIPVQPGGTVANAQLLQDGQPAPALTVHWFAPLGISTNKSGDTKPIARTKSPSVRDAAAACARAITTHLHNAQAGTLTRKGAPLRPQDCAVLVRTHTEGEAVRSALAEYGVAAVASGRDSLFDSPDAQELLTLLLALNHLDDARRLRAALSTRLLGQNARTIAALAHDEAAMMHWQERLQHWRTRWQQHGALAMLSEVIGQHAAPLLASFDGERRLANLMQLAELLQESPARSMSLEAQIDWLNQAIADADNSSDAQLPRLESDAGRVQIMTLHKSKGLEFPLVFLPFVGIGKGADNSRRWAVYTEAQGQRVITHKTAGDAAFKHAKEQEQAEQAEEQLRLLYVGLTRASDALWLACGALSGGKDSALDALIGTHSSLHTLAKRLPNAVLTSSEDDPAPIARLPAQHDDGQHVAPRQAQRTLVRGWWMHSFSQLHKGRPYSGHVPVEPAPADDEAHSVSIDKRFTGTRFGNALHHALEHADFVAWQDHDAAAAPPPTQQQVLIDALRAFGYRDKAEQGAGIAALSQLITRTLNAQMPEGIRLCMLPRLHRIDELEFHFNLRGASSHALLELLHDHELLTDRNTLGSWPQLSGLMTGKLDLTYRVDGKLYVLDYKSNQLPGYDHDAMHAAMQRSDYHLQALLYLVALQRWLRLRLGSGYQFDTHIGGARYVFCRGLNPEQPDHGIYVPELPQTLVDATEALLAPTAYTELAA